MGIVDLLKESAMACSETLNVLEVGTGSIKDNMDDLCEILESEIIKSKTSNEEKQRLLKRLHLDFSKEPLS